MSPLSASFQKPHILNLSGRRPAAFLRPIPSQTQGLYFGVSHLASGFVMLSGTGSLSSSTTYPRDRSSLIFSRRVDFGAMRSMHLFSPFQRNFYILGIFIKGLLIGKYAVSGPSMVTFTHSPTEYSSVPVKFPWHRTIHHWWTLFTLFSSFWNTLSDLQAHPYYPYYGTIPPLSSSGCIYRMRTEKNLLRIHFHPSLKFFYESWTYIDGCCCCCCCL